MVLDKTPIVAKAFHTVPTVREFAAHFMERYVIPRNKASEIDKKRQILDNFIIPLLGDLRLDELTASHIDEFVSRMRVAGAAPKTSNNRVGVLGKMLRYAKTREVIEVIPSIEPLKVLQKEIRFLTVSEAKRLIAAAGEIDAPWPQMILMGLLTGMRIGELRALHWEDLSMRRGVVRVHRSLYGRLETTTKTAHGTRTIKIDEVLLAALKSMLPLGPLVFSREPKGETLSYWACRDVLQATAKAAGLKGVGWHTLRHTFASHLVMLGYPIRTVQELLGHSDIKMTMRYSHLTPDAKAGAVNALARLILS